MKNEAIARALTASNLAEGGALVPEEFVGEEFIEYLRAQAVVRASGARVVSITSDTALYPKQTGGATASYQGEAQDVTKSEQTVGQLRATARWLTVLTPISNKLIRHAALGVDALIRDDLLGAIAEKEDITFIRAAGSEHQPKGILYWTLAANKFNANGTVNVANVNADLVKAVRLVGAA
jgi:HK97 family phage major capsid protein